MKSRTLRARGSAPKKVSCADPYRPRRSLIAYPTNRAFFRAECCVYEKTVELNATSCSNTPAGPAWIYFPMSPRQARGRGRPRSRSKGVSIDDYST